MTEAMATAMLRALGLTRIRLLTSNPDNVAQLSALGIEVVECVPTTTFLCPFNRRQLAVKVACAGHGLVL